MVGRDSSGFVAALRITSGGVRDPGWGSNGAVSLDFGTSFQQGTGVAIDGSGRTIVVGSAANTGSTARLLVARLTTTGAVDFPYAGVKSLSATTGDPSDWKVAVGTDAKYYIGGGAYFGANATNLQFTAVRMLSTSFSLDSTWGTSGIAHTNFSGFANADAFGVALDSSNNRLVQEGVAR